MANKGEDITGHNYVADQLNWEQRVKTEVEAPRQWSEQWGPIFQEEKEGVDPLDEGVRLRQQFYESRIRHRTVRCFRAWPRSTTGRLRTSS